jgi:threonine dehydratase
MRTDVAASDAAGGGVADAAADAAAGVSAAVAARRRIAGVARHTPLERSASLSEAAGCDVLLKLECWQPTRSFKVRGAYNATALLTEAQRARGLVTASAGNHGQAVALAARHVGAHATIFVPAAAPEQKQRRIRRLGAELRSEATDYDDAEQRAQRHAAERGAVFIHAFSDAAVIAGQATVALEVLDDLPAVREVIVPVGGGGLIAGIGQVLKALAPDVRVIGVQSTETTAMYEAFRAGHAVDVPIPPTLADGLAGCTDEATYRRARAVVDELLLVDEQEIAAAIAALYRDDGVVAEGAGAVAAAAVLTGRVQLRGPAVVLITGGNIDARQLARILTDQTES